MRLQDEDRGNFLYPLFEEEVLGEAAGYRYHGKLFARGSNIGRAIDARITSGWKKFGQCSCFRKGNRMPNSLKENIFDIMTNDIRR